MDSINAEHSIRRYLGKARDLELAYLIAKGEEIALNISPRRPFLKSRGIEKQIRLLLNAALKVQNLYNKKMPADNRFYLVESLIQEGDVFVRSKIILGLILEHSDKIKAGLRSKDSYYEGGPSAPQTSVYLNSPEVQKMIEIAKATRKDNPVRYRQDNTMAILSGNQPEVEDDPNRPLDDINDFFKKEEHKEDEA